MDIEEFVKSNPIRKESKVSRLLKQKENILRLKNDGYQEKKILEFLSLNGIEVVQSTLNKFIRKYTVGQVTETKNTKKNGDLSWKCDPSGRLGSDDSDPEPRAAKVSSALVPEKKSEFVEINGRIIDVNYKPSWVDDDINLKDLL